MISTNFGRYLINTMKNEKKICGKLLLLKI
jgi:hypothetical protein